MQMLLRDRQTATLADALQAERWHHWLLHERSALTIELSKQASHYLRRSIRSTENEIKTIDRMIDSLTRRFPEAIPTLPRA